MLTRVPQIVTAVYRDL